MDSFSTGEVNLPWPMKAENLVWLHVDGCTVKEYYAENFSSELTKIQDELRYLDLRNIQVLFDPFLIPDLIKNTSFSPPDFECGPVTIEKLAMSNITMQIDLKGETNLDAFLNLTDSWDFIYLFETLMSNFNNSNHTCNFTNLRVIDDSYGHSHSSQHAYFLTSKSLFPEVRVYNISHSGLLDVPEELQNWSEHFPQLTIFDKSFNQLSEFRINDLSPSWNSQGIYINLQYNNITTLTTSFLEQALNLPKVSIDLKNNPVLMDCSLYAIFAEKVENGTLFSQIDQSNLSYILHTPCSMAGQKAAAKSTRYTGNAWLYVVIPVGILCLIGVIQLALFIRSRKLSSANSSDKLVMTP